MHIGGVASADELWVQDVSSTNTNAYATQDFETSSDAYDIFWADDFVVPSGKTWIIESIHVNGDCWNTASPNLLNASSLNCYIFANASGDVPDGMPAGYGGDGIWQESWSPSDANVTISNGSLGTPCSWDVDVVTPPVLSEGVYWLACYPAMDLSVGGQWGFNVSDTTNGFVAKVVNPGGGFGFPTTWTDINDASTFGSIGLTQQDVAFSLYGTEGSTPVVSSIDPSEGTNDGVVSVTITGENFVEGDTDAKLSGPAKADIPASNLTVVDANTLTCDFDLTGAEPGMYDVVVTTLYGEGVLEDGFEVTEPAADDDTDDDDDTGDDDDDNGGCGCAF
ncbi:MAG TPA: hypothetical protein ENF73_02305 [Proteobacteria bacterium]|nr:hypothetical protein [Pseudomonadota bacterium]